MKKMSLDDLVSTAEKLLENENDRTIEVRIAHNRNGKHGNSLWFPYPNKDLLKKFITMLNEEHGEGTHWIELR